MVAVVTGNSLGLIGSSAGVVGNHGQLGSAATGQGGDVAFVNAATGNLTIQRQDELLIGVGADIGIVRTYNSRGTFDYDNNDNWQLSLYRRVFGLTGTANTAGSSIKRTSADGAELTYTYDTTLAKYINKDGNGSFDTLSYSAGTNAWTWTDGDTRLTETYELQTAGTYRIKTLADTDGNALTYTYDAATSLITQVTDANGERTNLIYNTTTKQLTQINVVNSSNVTTTRIRYTYDTNTPVARLSTVSTDLTPADGVIADGKTYVTTYTYVGTTNYIAAITNSDGTKTSFTYDASNRIQTVSDYTTSSSTPNNITTFAYPTATTATISNTDSNGVALVTTLTYDANKQLTGIQGPAGSGQNILYSYDANGNVTQMTDSRGNITKYTYDANGNQLSQQDAAGNTITRTYSSTNQLLTETVYAIPDATPSDAILTASAPKTTRYVYDAKEHLRFIVSAEGRVTEYQYDTTVGKVGTRKTTITYTKDLFTTTGALTEAQMVTWTTGSGTTTTPATTVYAEDFSGTTSSFGLWGTENGNLAITNGGTASGQLTIKSGPATTAGWPGFSSNASFSYVTGQIFRAEVNLGATSAGRSLSLGLDGVDAAGGNRSFRLNFEGTGLSSSANDPAHPYVWSGSSLVTQANTTYVIEMEMGATGMTAYVYQKGLTRAQGWTTTMLTGAWASYQISGGTYEGPGVGATSDSLDNMSITQPGQTGTGTGSGIDKTQTHRTDYSYDARGQLSTLTTYNTVNSAGAGVVDANTATTQYVYDQRGNLIQSIDARGVASTANTTDFITSYGYDGLNRLISQTDALNNVTSTVYNDSIRQVKVTLANGLVTTSTYDLAGRLITVDNGQAATPTALGTTSYLYDKLGNLRQTTDATGQKTYFIYDNLGRKVGSIDPQGALTEYIYNNNNQIIRIVQYSTAVTGTLLTDANATKLTLTGTLGVRPSSGSGTTTTPATTVYAEDFSGTTSSFGLWGTENGNLAITNGGTASGQLTIKSGPATTAGWPGFSSNASFSYVTGQIFRAEVNLGATSAGRSLSLGLDGVDAAGGNRSFRLNFEGTGLSSSANDPAHPYVWSGSSLVTQANTTYVIEMEMGATGMTAYVYQKGLTRAQGWTTTMLTGAWASYQISGGTYEGPGVGATSDSLDNMSITQPGQTGTGTTTTTSTADRTHRNVYDKAGRLAKQIDALGYVVEYQYDGANRLVKTIGYANALSSTQLTALAAMTTEPLATDANTIAVVDANSTNNRINRQFYSDDGLLIGKLDAEGYFTQYSYDAAGRNTRVVRYKNAAQLFGTATLDAGIPTLVSTAPTAGNVLYLITDAANDQTSYNIYNARGELEGTVDALGYLTEFQYDVSGNRIVTKRYATAITYTPGASVAASRPTANAEDQSTTNTFDDNNRLKTSTSNPDGLSTEYTYDNVGNITQQVRTYAGATNTDKRSQFKQYDQLGRVTRELSGEGVLYLQTFGATPTQLQIDDAYNIYGTRYTYDLAGRVIIATAPNGSNATGNKTWNYYDTEGKLKYQINAVGEVTQYSYNNFDQRTSTRQYKTRLSTTTLAGLTGGMATAIDATITNTTTGLVVGGYVETTTVYDNAGRAISLTDALTNTNTRTYNVFGELNSTTNKIDASNNLVTNYTYDKRGLVKTTTEDSAGLNRITAAIYDAFGRITQTTDGRGGLIKHAYDRLGREVTTTDGLNTNTVTTYDAFSRVLTRRDGRGVAGNYNTVTYSYNSTNRSMTMTTAEGISVTSEKNRFGETVKVTDGRSNVTTYTYNADGQLKQTIEDQGSGKLNLTQSNAYDQAGRLMTVTDARGTQTTFAYDAANRTLSKTVDPTGLNLKTEYRHDALGRQTWIKDAKGIWTRTDYDAKGQVTSMVVDPTNIPGTADANGLFGTVANPAGALSLNITTNFTYDARGKRLTVVEGAGTTAAKTTQYLYDKLGRLQQSIVDPGAGKLNLTTSYSYDKNDNVVLKTDANLNKTVYTYDANNRLIYTVDALGNVTKNDYDVNGNVMTTTVYASTTTTVLATLQAAPTTTTAIVVNDANTANRISRHVYDKDNRRTFSIDALNQVTRYEYDANGNVTKTTQYANAVVTPAAGIAPTLGTTAGTSNYIITSTANDRVTQASYDAANRLVTSTDALNTITKYDYDANGNQTQVTEAFGLATQRITKQEFDKANRKTAAIDALNNRTETTYDATGNISSVKDAKGNLGYFYYDAAGRMTLQVNPEGAVTETKYDAIGNQTDIIRYSNKVTGTPTVTAKPVIGGTTGVYVTLNANLDQLQQVSYDAAGRKLTIKTAFANSGGQTLTVGTNAYQESFTYDALGNVKTATARNGATTTYTYDKLNRKATETLPISSRNASNVLTAVQNSFAYDAFGNLLTKTEAVGLPEQRLTTYTYDKLNRQSTEVGQTFTAFNPVTQTDVSVTPTKTNTYDVRGNLTSETDAAGNKTWYYYDLLNHKVGEVDAKGDYTTYAYDTVGNKLSQTRYANTVTPVTGVPVSVSFSADDRTTLTTYDKMGRVLTTEIQAITYGSVNTSNQYIVSTGSLKTQLIYDVLGNVIKEIDANNSGLPLANQKATRHWYNKAGDKIATLDAEGYLTTWTRDALNNITTETKYANKVQLMGTATLDNASPQALAAAPAAGSNALYVITNAANDRTTQMGFDRANRVLTETKLAVAQGAVNATTGALTTSTANATTSYVYDGLSNVTQKTDATNAVTNWTFDGIGRQTSQLNPQLTDYQGAVVRPRTDQEYDGLNNVKREIARGKDNTAAATNSGQVETDDHITSYEYGIGGRLTAEVDATGARTEYRYDANSNISKKTLKNRRTADQVIANTAGVDDVTTYTYDALNRQSKSTDIGTGLISEVQYNSFGEISGKRSYVGTAPTTWTEFAQYDQAGRTWKSNSGDGVTKVNVYDQNGNATLEISGTLNMNSMSLSQVLAQKALDTTNNVPQQTLYTMRVYDGRNQLSNTIQPSMDSSSSSVTIQQINNVKANVVQNATSLVYTRDDDSLNGFNYTNGEVRNSSFGAVIKDDGSVVSLIADGDSAIATQNPNTSTVTYTSVANQLNGTIRAVQIFSSYKAYAALRADGSVVTWGDSTSGGDSSSVASKINGSIRVVSIFSAGSWFGSAFAALRVDGSVVTWGGAYQGGDTSLTASYDANGTPVLVADLLNGSIPVTKIYSNITSGAFAALRADGSVVSWGGGPNSGYINGIVTTLDTTTNTTQSLDGSIPVVRIYSNGDSFAAMRSNGSVVTWGSAPYQGHVSESHGTPSQVNGQIPVTQIVQSYDGYSAIRADGSVVSWGFGSVNLPPDAAMPRFIEYPNSAIPAIKIYSTVNGGFAALRADGSVVSWGLVYNGINNGYDSSAVANQLNGSVKVKQIYSTESGFAALREDGSVVTWGGALAGGDSSLVATKLNGNIEVKEIYATRFGFAA
ncbi:MAG TPA: hypothetical protein PLZ85_01275, partial [Methylotenera sp.]|nr:hypothetical protein [Methylotenera sp.]